MSPLPSSAPAEHLTVIDESTADAPLGALHAREDLGLAARLARSAATRTGAHLSLEEFPGWLAGRGEANAFRVDRIPFSELEGWYFEADTGNLVHRSGRFFSVEGLQVSTDSGPYPSWHQPIIKQPEVGILGILVKEFDGVLHLLMQAKMEPGNPNLLQLSPTVQATRSNYTKVHQGADVKYIQYFNGPQRGRVLADVLQSEHGSWFYRKSNRNMLVEVDGEVELDPDFCWLTLGQVNALLHRDNVVNMDSRTVLSCLPAYRGETSFALHPDVEVLSWFTAERSDRTVQAERIPLADLPDWTSGETTISHDEGRFYDVVAVRVQAGNREVTGWTQPLIEPRSTGVAALLHRRIGGVSHVLVNAKMEGGFLDTIELAPTVQCAPENHEGLSGAERPPFLDFVLDTLQRHPERVRYDALHAEEGGRFLNAVNRYLVIDADEADAPLAEPEGFRWVTAPQLSGLIRHPHYVNVQARTLVACLNAMQPAGTEQDGIGGGTDV